MSESRACGRRQIKDRFSLTWRRGRQGPCGKKERRGVLDCEQTHLSDGGCEDTGPLTGAVSGPNIVLQFSLQPCEGGEKGRPCVPPRNKLRDRGLSNSLLGVSRMEAMSALNPSGLPTPLLSLDPSLPGIVVSVSTSHACSPLDRVRATSGSLRDQRPCPGQGGPSAVLAG